MKITPEQLRQSLLTTHRRMDDLIHEARCLQSGNAVNIDRVMAQLAAANEMAPLKYWNLPRGYSWFDNDKRKYGFHLRLNGREVESTQLALDIATGWLDEVADLIDSKLDKQYPNRRLAIAAPETETEKTDESEDAAS